MIFILRVCFFYSRFLGKLTMGLNEMKKNVYYIVMGAYAANNQLLYVCGGGMAVWFTSTDEEKNISLLQLRVGLPLASRCTPSQSVTKMWQFDGIFLLLQFTKQTKLHRHDITDLLLLLEVT